MHAKLMPKIFQVKRGAILCTKPVGKSCLTWLSYAPTHLNKVSDKLTPMHHCSRWHQGQCKDV